MLQLSKLNNFGGANPEVETEMNTMHFLSVFRFWPSSRNNVAGKLSKHKHKFVMRNLKKNKNLNSGCRSVVHEDAKKFGKCGHVFR